MQIKFKCQLKKKAFLKAVVKFKIIRTEFLKLIIWQLISEPNEIQLDTIKFKMKIIIILIFYHAFLKIHVRNYKMKNKKMNFNLLDFIKMIILIQTI